MIDEKQHDKIKAALSLRGITLTAIARQLSVAPTTIMNRPGIAGGSNS